MVAENWERSEWNHGRRRRYSLDEVQLVVVETVWKAELVRVVKSDLV